MLRPSKIVVAVTAAIAAASVVGAASAGSSSGMPVCPWPVLVQPFLLWGDSQQYFLAPGGDFEATVSGWSLTGAATVVQGNEPYRVGASTDSRSLVLPTTTSSVTTPTICVTSQAPTFRLFIKNNGLNGYTDGQLAFYLNFTGANGKPQKVKIAGLKGSKTSWILSQPISFIQYISTPLKTGYAYVSFTITPNDNHGSWQIDDIYVDPRKSY